MTCKTCQGPVGRRNTSGYCRKCFGPFLASQPEWKERQRAGVLRKLETDPEFHAGLRKRASKMGRDPETRAKRAKFFTENRVWELGNKAQPKGSEARKKAGKSISATRLAWCPPELRDEYRRLVNWQHIPAAEARKMILEQHEAEMRRWRARHGLMEVRLESEWTPPVVATLDPVERAVVSAADWAGVPVEALKAESRDRHLVRARQLAWAVLAERGFNPGKIAQVFGKDRTTVRHGIIQAQELRQRDPSFAQAFERLAA